MKVLIVLLTIFSAPLLALGITGLILDQTLLNSDHLKSTAQRLKVYDELSTALPAMLARKEASPTEASQPVIDPEAQAEQAYMQAALTQILTPAFIQSHLEKTMEGIENQYKHQGPPAELDLRDLPAQAEAAGLPLPPDQVQQLQEPLVLKPPTGIPTEQVSQGMNLAKYISLILGGLMLAALIVLEVIQRRFAGLATALLSTGVGLMIFWFGFMNVLPNWMNSWIKPDQAGGVMDVAVRFLGALSQDTAAMLSLYGRVFLAAGALIMIINTVIVLRAHSRGTTVSTKPKTPAAA